MIQNKDVLWIKSMEWSKKYCGCHQMPERSFFYKGYQLPLCARCTGIALGHIAAFVMAPFYVFKYSILILMIPMALDGTVQYFSSYRSNNAKRLGTGFLYGFAFTSAIFRTVNLTVRYLKTKSSPHLTGKKPLHSFFHQ